PYLVRKVMTRLDVSWKLWDETAEAARTQPRAKLRLWDIVISFWLEIVILAILWEWLVDLSPGPLKMM
ncbi:MAG: hypothetical protein WBO94_03065, partial [Nitrospira sp.]